VRFVLATASEHKAAEITAILGAALPEIELVPRPAGAPDVVEDGLTFEDNARLKAVALCRATGLAAIADDTGLEVDALDGAPGVHSARFASGPDRPPDVDRNVALLLERLRGLPAEGRTARFVTVALAHFTDGREVIAFGEVEGRIVDEQHAVDSGFAYDRVFAPDEGDGRTFAEMSSQEKHEVSHRGRAFRTLADGLRIMTRAGYPTGASVGEPGIPASRERPIDQE
jgi:XTP/dITP diphosphohydrolase